MTRPAELIPADRIIVGHGVTPVRRAAAPVGVWFGCGGHLLEATYLMPVDHTETGWVRWSAPPGGGALTAA